MMCGKTKQAASPFCPQIMTIEKIIHNSLENVQVNNIDM